MKSTKPRTEKQVIACRRNWNLMRLRGVSATIKAIKNAEQCDRNIEASLTAADKSIDYVLQQLTKRYKPITHIERPDHAEM